jgi:hypothetical protein
MLGNLVTGAGMYDGADGIAGLGELVPADSAESTGHDYPQSPGWRKRLAVLILVWIPLSELK